jgi:hypothetical protein
VGRARSETTLNHERMTRMSDAELTPNEVRAAGGAVCRSCGERMLLVDGCTAGWRELPVAGGGVQSFAPIQYGSECWDGAAELLPPTERCHDCGCLPGCYHHPECDDERCPKWHRADASSASNGFTTRCRRWTRRSSTPCSTRQRHVAGTRMSCANSHGCGLRRVAHPTRQLADRSDDPRRAPQLVAHAVSFRIVAVSGRGHGRRRRNAAGDRRRLECAIAASGGSARAGLASAASLSPF